MFEFSFWPDSSHLTNAFPDLRKVLADTYEKIPSADPTSIKKNAAKAYNEILRLGSTYLTPAYIKEKTKNSIKAKILPFSDPSGWKEKELKAIKTLNRYLFLKKKFSLELEQINLQLVPYQTSTHSISTSSSQQKIQQALIEQKEIKEKQLAAINLRLEGAQKHLKHLYTIRTAQIGGRFAGLFVNAVTPGASIPVGLAITGAVTVIQEKSAQKLANEHPSQFENEKKNVRLSTLTTIACTVICLACSLIILPRLKNLF